MARCWESRGCDEDMQARCPHSDNPAEKCPARCAIGQCYNPQHKVTSDPGLVFAPEIDRSACAKEACLFCAFFLTKGPHVA